MSRDGANVLGISTTFVIGTDSDTALRLYRYGSINLGGISPAGVGYGGVDGEILAGYYVLIRIAINFHLKVGCRILVNSGAFPTELWYRYIVTDRPIQLVPVSAVSRQPPPPHVWYETKCSGVVDIPGHGNMDSGIGRDSAYPKPIARLKTTTSGIRLDLVQAIWTHGVYQGYGNISWMSY